MANNILSYIGNPIGKSIKEEECDSIIDDIFKTAKNHSCKIVYPEDGTVAAPDGIALVKNGPNSQNGKIFIEGAFFTSGILIWHIVIS